MRKSQQQSEEIFERKKWKVRSKQNAQASGLNCIWKNAKIINETKSRGTNCFSE